MCIKMTVDSNTMLNAVYICVAFIVKQKLGKFLARNVYGIKFCAIILTYFCILSPSVYVLPINYCWEHI